MAYEAILAEALAFLEQEPSKQWCGNIALAIIKYA